MHRPQRISAELGADDPFRINQHRQAARASRSSAIEQLEASLDDYDGFQDGKTLSWNRFKSRQRTAGAVLEECESQMADDLGRCHKVLGMFRKFPKRDELSCELQHCSDIFISSKVKVAVIDNGVDQMHFALSQSIERGASFVRAGGATEVPELPWYTAADPHGTHMAYLIHTINPWCRLFPLRVGTMRKDIDADAAVKAVEWAIEQEVDIISISRVVMKRNPALKAAIQKAVDSHKILVYCSTADTGSQSHGDVYPANYDRLVTAVSASDRFGWARVESCHDVHVMLGGEEVTAQGPKYMEQPKSRISGSSVATALAAGLASLCLFLARMANERGDWDEFKDRDAMLHIFRKMQESDTNRVITPAKLFDDDFEFKDDFYRGIYAPPIGLQKLKWAILSKEINRNAPFSGDYPRRAMSAERSRDTRLTQMRRPNGPIAVNS